MCWWTKPESKFRIKESKNLLSISHHKELDSIHRIQHSINAPNNIKCSNNLHHVGHNPNEATHLRQPTSRGRFELQKAKDWDCIGLGRDIDDPEVCRHRQWGENRSNHEIQWDQLFRFLGHQHPRTHLETNERRSQRDCQQEASRGGLEEPLEPEPREVPAESLQNCKLHPILERLRRASWRCIDGPHYCRRREGQNCACSSRSLVVTNSASFLVQRHFRWALRVRSLHRRRRVHPRASRLDRLERLKVRAIGWSLLLVLRLHVSGRNCSPQQHSQNFS